MFDQRHMQSAYLHLVQCACEGRTTSVEEFIEAAKYGTWDQVVAFVPIAKAITVWTESKGQPSLTALIVRASGGSKGLPPESLWPSLGLPAIYGDDIIRPALELLQRGCFTYYQGTGVNSSAVRKRVSQGIKTLRWYSEDQTLYNTLVNLDMSPYALGKHTKPRLSLGQLTPRNVNLDAAIDSWMQANIKGIHYTETVTPVAVSVMDTFMLQRRIPADTRVTGIKSIIACSEKDIELPTYELALYSALGDKETRYLIKQQDTTVGEIVLGFNPVSVSVTFATRDDIGGLKNNAPDVTSVLLLLNTITLNR